MVFAKIYRAKFEKTRQIKTIIFDGALGATLFNFESFQKITDEVRDIHRKIIA